MKKSILQFILLLMLPTASCLAQCDVQLTVVNHISCNGICDGKLLAGSIGVAPFIYEWNPSISSDSVASDLCAGAYTITITDDNGCSSSATAEITEPDPLNIAATLSPITCYGACNGTIDVTVSGGTSPYQYLWSNNDTTEDQDSICAGSLCLYITDANNCITDRCDFNFIEPDPLTVSLILLSGSDFISCHGDTNESVLALAGGGTTPYHYNWSNGKTDELVNNLGAGTYIITVTDTNNCSVTDSVTLTQPDPFNIEFNLSDYNGFNVSCFGALDGSICASVSGQTSPYSFSWSPSGLTDSCATGQGEGQNCVIIMDANGCYVDTCFTLTSPTALTDYITFSEPTCSGCSDGWMRDSVDGGVPPYTYEWFPSISSDSIATDLSAGTYSVCATDANGCSICNSITLNDPPLSVKNSGLKLSAHISPNPTTGKFSLTFTSALQNASINIVNAIGQIVYSEIYTGAAGSRKEFDINISSGIYIVQVQSDKINWTVKMLKE